MQPASLSRRNTLRLLAASLSAPALGYWAQGRAEVIKLTASSGFSTARQNTLVAVTDTLIPKGDSWGAVELGVPLYLLAYFRECIQADERENIGRQLTELEQRCQQKFSVAFNQCPRQQRESLLQEFSLSSREEERQFFEQVKAQCIHGFLNTAEVMTGPYRFRIVPGHFKGCVDVKEPTIT